MKRCLACFHMFISDDWVCPNCHHIPARIDHFLAFAPDLAVDADHYSPELHEGLAALETGHFWFEARNDLILSMLRRYFPASHNFLEIGCGTGFVLQHLDATCPEMHLFGSDLFSSGLKFAAERVNRVNFFQMDARQIPYQDEFDVIGAFDVIEHIEDDGAVLDQMCQAVKPGGGLMLSVPQHQFMWSIVDDLSYHKRRYSRQELVSKVEAAGFQIMHTTSFVSLLLPLMWLARYGKTAQADNFDLLGEFKLSPLLNNLLRYVMAVEKKIIQSGFSFPFGGSLLLIAKRPIG